MVKTGKSFDMNPDTFTLDNLFAMELHNFKEVIADIVTSASKELSIEKASTMFLITKCHMDQGYLDFTVIVFGFEIDDCRSLDGMSTVLRETIE